MKNRLRRKNSSCCFLIPDNIFIIFLAVFTLLVSVNDLCAVPAAPGYFEYKQPDGTKFNACLKGDEFYHRMETKDGYSVYHNKDSGWYEYHNLDAKGKFVRTTLKVGIDDPSKKGIPCNLKEARTVIKDRISALRAAKANISIKTNVSGQSQKSSITGIVKPLVILANFSDTVPVYSSSDINSLFNTPGYNQNGANGSVKDYYNEATYNQLDIEATISPWVTLPHTKAYYGANDYWDNDVRPQEMVRDAILALDALGFDFSPFDADGDGVLDVAVDVIHQGGGEEAGAGDNCIWSHAWDIPTITVDGVAISRYHTEPEQLVLPTYNYSGITTIGVICHEMGHAVCNLPDLYDTDYSSNGIGDWCLMAGGGWNGGLGDGSRPAHFSAWAKLECGWETPQVLATNQSGIPVLTGNSNKSIFKITNGMQTPDEYLLVENRQKSGFDDGLPSAGLLVWHVDDSISTNDDETHYKVALLQADGKKNLENGDNRGDAGDPYPGTSNNRTISFASNPNTNSYYNGATSTVISNISSSASTMTFNLTVGVEVDPTNQVLYGMGSNSFGQLGDGTTLDRLSPVLVGLSTMSAVAAGGSNHSLFLEYDGSLWAMGWNGYGQLGDGTTNNLLVPKKIVPFGVKKIATANYHSLFLLDDGTIWSMGWNAYGQLGDGTTKDRPSFVQINLPGVIAISASSYNSLFLKNDGTLWGTGWNGYGQLGLADTVNNQTRPVQIATGVTAMAAGEGYTLFIKADGSLWGMGSNANGQLGLGTTDQLIPTEIVPADVTTVTAVSAGNHSLFLKSNGSLWGMGYNGNGQLGDGTLVDKTSPTQILSSGVKAISAAGGGGKHSLFIKTDGSLWGMGYNGNGQLGLGNTTDHVSPTLILPSDVTDISAGAHSLFLKNRYLYTVTFAAGANGTISGTQIQKIPQGSDSAPVNAVPNTGYHFVNWTGTGSFTASTENPLTLKTVVEDMTITANFAINDVQIATDSTSLNINEGSTATFQVKLTAQPLAGKIVTVSKTSGDTDITVSSGGTLTFTTANWNINQTVTLAAGTDADLANDSAIITVSMPGANDKTVSVTGIDTDTTLIIRSSSKGTTDPAGTVFPTKNMPFEIIAEPFTGYHLSNWSFISKSGTGSFANPTSAKTTVTISDAATIYPNFVLNTYSVNFIPGANGKILGTASQTISHGSSFIPVKAVPDANYHFVNWTGFITSTSNPLPAETVISDMDVTANFEHDTTFLTLASSGSGTTAPLAESITEVNTATPIRIQASPEPGNSFAGWSVSGNAVVLDSDSSDTTVTLSGNATVKATFITGTVTTITDNLAVGPLTGIKDSMQMFKIAVPALTTSFNITISGGTGDCDIYAKLGSAPSLKDYYDKATGPGIDESLDIINPASGIWYIMIYGYEDYAGKSLLVTFGTGGPAKVTGLAVASPIKTDRVSLSWTAASGATSYEVWRSDVNDVGLATKLNSSTVTATSYDDIFSAGAFRYYYWVRSVNNSGIGEFSSPVYGTNTAAGIINLANGIPVTKLSGNAGSVKTYRLTVSDTLQTLLEVNVSGGTGDCDIALVQPDGSVIKKSVRGSSNELIQIQGPISKGAWLINLYGQSNYSGLTILAKYSKGLPAAPAGLAASDGLFADRILLNWTASSGATSYEIWRGPKMSPTDVMGPATRIDEVSDNTYEDLKDASTLIPGTPYFYFVKAKNAEGTSVFSGGNSGYLMSAPVAPASVAASDGTYFDKIRVTWPAAKGATSYKIYRGAVANPASLIKEISHLNQTTYTYDDMGGALLNPGTVYTYWVEAVNLNGVKLVVKSDTGSLSSKAPATVAATSGTLFGKVKISWAAVAGATAYDVYRYTDKACTLNQAVVYSGSNLFFEDSSATVQTPRTTDNIYYYKVKAKYLAFYTSDFSLPAAGYHKVMPGPGAVTASAGTYLGMVHITWAAVTGATGYDVYKYTSKSMLNPTIYSAGAKLYYDDTDAAASTALNPSYYKVLAKSDDNNGHVWTSNLSTAASGYYRNLAVPSSITASAGTFFGKVQVKWASVPGAATYDVYRYTDKNLANERVFHAGANLMYNDTTAAAGTGYYYTVRAISGLGTSNPGLLVPGYAYSGVTIATLATPILTASKDLYSYVKLSWTEIPLAENYIIYRGTTNVFASPTTVELTRVTTLAHNDLADPGKLYYYWIKANNNTIPKTSLQSATAVQGRALSIVDSLQNDDTKLGSGAKDSCTTYSILVPPGTTRLVATLTGTGSAVNNDCDIYAKLGACPTTTSFNVKGMESAAGETLTVTNPSSGTWYFLLYGVTDYANVTLKVNFYSVIDIILTQVPSNDLAVPFTASFKGRVVDDEKKDSVGGGIGGLSIQVRNPITGIISLLPAKTDASGYFTYSALINTEGEHTFDFFFNTMPDNAKGTASHTVTTRKGCLESNSFFDYSAYLPATPISVPLQTDVIGFQTYLDIRNGWSEGVIDSKYEELWINSTLVAASTDAALLGKLDEGLYMFFYGFEGAGVGNDTTANSALSAIPFVVHVDSSKLETVVANLYTLGIVDDTQKDAVLISKRIGVVTVAAFSNPGEGTIDWDKITSLLGREQLEVLANIAAGTASENLIAPEGNKYSDVIAKKFSVDLNRATKKLNVKTSAFVK